MGSMFRDARPFDKLRVSGIPPAAPPWIPAFAGMTKGGCGKDEDGEGEGKDWIPAFAGMTESEAGMTKGWRE